MRWGACTPTSAACQGRARAGGRRRRGRSRGLRRPAGRRRGDPCRPGAAARCPGWPTPSCSPPAARERVYAQVVARALAWTAVVIPAAEVDRIGLHEANIEGMRRAVAAPRRPPGLRPDRRVPGGRPWRPPASRVWKGDRVAACIAAASVIAKVTRDRLMVAMHDDFPLYGFAEHKGYITPEHQDALAEHGPCAEHRRSFINVRTGGVRWARGGARVIRSVGRRRHDDAGTRASDAGIRGREIGWRSCDERGGSRELRDRHGAAALSGVPRRRRPVQVRRSRPSAAST